VTSLSKDIRPSACIPVEAETKDRYATIRFLISTGSKSNDARQPSRLSYHKKTPTKYFFTANTDNWVGVDCCRDCYRLGFVGIDWSNGLASCCWIHHHHHRCRHRLRIGSSGVVWVRQDAPRGDDASSFGDPACGCRWALALRDSMLLASMLRDSMLLGNILLCLRKLLLS
jgi:hypothetical protein